MDSSNWRQQDAVTMETYREKTYGFLIWSIWTLVSRLWFMRNFQQELCHVRIRGLGREDVRLTHCASPLKAIDFCSNKKTYILGRHWQVRSPRQKKRSFFSKTPFSPSQTTELKIWEERRGVVSESRRAGVCLGWAVSPGSYQTREVLQAFTGKTSILQLSLRWSQKAKHLSRTLISKKPTTSLFPMLDSEFQVKFLILPLPWASSGPYPPGSSDKLSIRAWMVPRSQMWVSY